MGRAGVYPRRDQPQTWRRGQAPALPNKLRRGRPLDAPPTWDAGRRGRLPLSRGDVTRSVTKGIGIAGPYAKAGVGARFARPRAATWGRPYHVPITPTNPNLSPQTTKTAPAPFRNRRGLRYKYGFMPGSGPPPDGRRRTAPAAWAFRSCRWGCGGRWQR